MKPILLIIGIILILPFAFADNENGKLTSGGDLLITDFDVKIDGLTSRNIEYGDSISRIANPSSLIEFDLQLKNNHTNLDMGDIEVIIQIEDLDLEKTITATSLTNNNDKRFKAEMTLPSDAEERDYEVFVEASGELNNTIHRVEYVFDIEVETSSSADSSSSNPTILQQLNDSLSKLNTDLNYYPLYTQCYSDYELCKTDLNTKNTKISELEPMKSNYETCSQSLTTAQSDIQLCNNDKATFQTTSDNCIQELDKSKKNGMLYGALGALCVGGIWAFRNRKQTPSTKKLKIARS